MARHSLRNKLLDAGLSVLHARGFSATGVREVMHVADAPLGSFTNHFRSKEGFALAVLELYFDQLSVMVDATLRDTRLTPIDRIDAYFAEIDRVARPFAWGHGCMIANFGSEMPTLSETIRLRLAELLQALTVPFADALRAGQASGDVRGDIDADDLAMLLLSGWHGVLLRAKVERSGAPLSRYWRTLRVMLAPPPAQAGCVSAKSLDADQRQGHVTSR